MDILLLIVGFGCLFVGLAGAVLPLPGPPLSFAGILAINYSKFGNFSDDLLYGLGVATIVITVLDYYIPIWGTKKFGGSKWGTYGSAIGLLIGLFMGPFGLFIGAFLGAFIGEYLKDKNQEIAFKAAIGSFLGLIAGIVAKVSLCIVMLFYAVKEVYYSFQ
jgi:uncharacterized protein